MDTAPVLDAARGVELSLALPPPPRALQRKRASSPPPCAEWKPQDFCLASGLDPDGLSRFERLLARRSRLRRGHVIYRVGDAFTTLFAIRSGSCKTVLLAKDGQGQVAGYHMAGDVIGIDGIAGARHQCDAAALEDMEVCPLPFEQVENLARQNELFRQNVQGLLSQDGARVRGLMTVLGTMRAEQRLASFLLDLSQQYRVRGYSSCEFVLRLTREEIGSYLGLKLETVSRLFSQFQREGLIRVEGRAVTLRDKAALNQLICQRDA